MRQRLGVATSLVAASLIAFLLVGLWVKWMAHHDASVLVDKNKTHIYEDDPRWRCAEMGNRICGTTQP